LSLRLRQVNGVKSSSRAFRSGPESHECICEAFIAIAFGLEKQRVSNRQRYTRPGEVLSRCGPFSCAETESPKPLFVA